MKTTALLGDIGGSNVRLVVAEMDSNAPGGFRLGQSEVVRWGDINAPLDKKALCAFQTGFDRLMTSTGMDPSLISSVVMTGAGVATPTSLELDKYPEKRLDFAHILPRIGVPEHTRLIVRNDAAAQAAGTLTLGPDDISDLNGHSTAGCKTLLFRPGTGVGVATVIKLPDGKTSVVMCSEGGNLPAGVHRSEAAARPWSRMLEQICSEMVTTGYPGCTIREIGIEGLQRGPVTEPRLEMFTSSQGLVHIGHFFGLGWKSPEEVADAAIAGGETGEKILRAYSALTGYHLRHLAMTLQPDRVIIGGIFSKQPGLLKSGALISSMISAPGVAHQKMLENIQVGVIMGRADHDLGLRGAGYCLFAEKQGKTLHFV